MMNEIFFSLAMKIEIFQHGHLLSSLLSLFTAASVHAYERCSA